ncbi:hypothetical protein BH09PSE5_BH09PSE5_04820 [soil metagenome]
MQAFRKQSGMTQADVALRLGVSQQTLSSLERNAEGVGAGRLLQLLGILGVELVLRDASSDARTAAADNAGSGDTPGPQW